MDENLIFLKSTLLEPAPLFVYLQETEGSETLY